MVIFHIIHNISAYTVYAQTLLQNVLDHLKSKKKKKKKKKSMKISNDTADIIKQKFLYFLTSGDDPVQYIKSAHQKCKKKKSWLY